MTVELVGEAERFVSNILKSKGEARSEDLIRSIQQFMSENHAQRNWIPPIRLIPSLCKIVNLEYRINSRVLAAVSTRPVVTLYELEREMCLIESVSSFRELRLGETLLHLPIVQQYFQLQPPSAVPSVTSADFIWFLKHDANAQAVVVAGGDAQSLMNQFAKLCGVSGNPRKVGVHIQNIEWLIQIARSELATASHLNSVSEKAEEHVRNCFAVSNCFRTAVLDHCLSGKKETLINIEIETSLLFMIFPTIASVSSTTTIALQLSRRDSSNGNFDRYVLGSRPAFKKSGIVKSGPLAIVGATVVPVPPTYHDFATCFMMYSTPDEKASMDRAVKAMRCDEASCASGADFKILQRLRMPLDEIQRQWETLVAVQPDKNLDSISDEVDAYNRAL